MKAAVLPRPRGRPGYLLSRLLLVVLAVVVPLLALQALSLLNDKRAAEEASFRSLEARADGAAASVEDVLSRAEQLLVFLASRDQVRSLDRAGCSSLVRGVSAVGRVYANVLLIDLHGRLVCSAVPGLAPDRFEDQPWFRAGLQREGFTLGAPIFGRLTGRRVALLTLPVNAGGEKVGVLAAALDMRALSGLLTREDLPPGATLNVVQGGARSISRLPYDDASIERGLGEALRATQVDARLAMATATGEDGVLRAFAARPIPKYGLSVLAGMPAQAMHAQANEGLLRSVAIAALVASLGLAAAFLASRRLAAPLRSIAGTARRLQAGETTTRADEALPGEFGEVAVELNRLLDRHDARTAELRLSEKHALRIGAFYEALSSTNQAIVRMDPERLFQEICLVCVRTQLADVAWIGLVEGAAIQPVAGAGRGCEHQDVRSAARRLSTEPLAASAVRQGYPVKDDDFQAHSRDMSWLDCLPGFEVRSAAAFPFSCDGVVAGVLTLYVGEPRYFDGELVALLQNMMRDISLALEAHKRKASTAAMLDAQAANRAKTTFLSNISHELRTPLNAILGFTQLLQIHARHALDQQARQQLDHVSMAGTQLRALIDDLMDVSRIEAGEVTLQLKEVELPALLDTVVALSEPLAQTHQVTLQADYARSLPLRFSTDPTRLRQVLLNLLSNAIKYNRPGGQVRFSASCEDGRLMLRVVDDGIGMSPSQLRELFQGFNRLGRESSAIEGTGIGLRLTRQLVGLLGGELGVQSAENEGTQVSVTLPCRPAAEGAAPLRVLGGHTTLARARGVVLYIEDNPVNAQLMEHLLLALPEVRLVVCATGAEGLAQAAALRPDLVLLDMHLPDMSGLEVLSRLRGAEPADAPRVVALSASAMPDEVGAAMQAGVEAYWTKPIDFTQVLQGVAERLSSAANAPHAGWRRLNGTA